MTMGWFFISLDNLNFSQYRFLALKVHICVSFIKFILQHFMLLDDVVNGIVLLISLWNFSLQVYKNATDFLTMDLVSSNFVELIYWLIDF